METNTKIAIRGRGSVKEGAARDPKYDYGEDEELHVLITGDSQARSSIQLLMCHIHSPQGLCRLTIAVSAHEHWWSYHIGGHCKQLPHAVIGQQLRAALPVPAPVRATSECPETMGPLHNSPRFT